MSGEKKVYVVVEDWRIDSGESGVYTSVFSSMENAKEYFKKLKIRYWNDYELCERDDKYIDETDMQIEVTFEDNYDYYKIIIDEKIIDSEKE